MRWLVIGLVAVAATAHGQVYRCNDGGRTVYSDKPCGDAAASVSVPVMPRAAEPSPDAGLQLEALRKRLAVGMTPQQVELAWGKPATIRKTTGSQGRTEEWVYGGGESTSTVRFFAGRVVSFSTETSIGAAPAPPAALPPAVDADAAARAERAGERKFVREGDSQAGVERRLGPPDAHGYANALTWWMYAPQPKDSQTRTTIWFDGDRVIKVERAVAR